ncbi:hypothetical protein LTR49_027446 [Elasticomyces elasticus]|nr:hypothetical protein LTR49_027446 [Elasticomyces elasticus]
MLCQDQPFGEAKVVSNKMDQDTALQELNNEGKPYNPAYDRRDMRRLGHVQEVKRPFRFFSLVGYMVILASTWEFALVTSAFSLSNGGTAGTIWLTLIACCGMFLSCLSMAEMASISPQREDNKINEERSDKISETRLTLLPIATKISLGERVRSTRIPEAFAVRRWLVMCPGMASKSQRITKSKSEYRANKSSILQSAMPLISYTAAQQIIALIAMCQADFVWRGWQGALLTIAFVVFAILFNMFPINKMPLIEGLVVIIHLFGFVTFVVIFWVLGPREPASRVFTEFQDQNGWGSYGSATLVAVVGPSAALIGADAAVHLAEELKDASYILPRAMVSSALINYATAFTMIISFVSAIDPALLNDVLATSTGQPWVAVIRHVTGSQAATIALAVVMCFQFTFTSINQATTSSRQLWAFARDKGLPFHRFLSKVSERDGVPHNGMINIIFHWLSTNSLDSGLRNSRLNSNLLDGNIRSAERSRIRDVR